MGVEKTEFRILGPVEAVLDGRPVALGGPKQRALLALLLLRANETVSREALVDALWGAEPPRSAVQSLQVYIHGLRQALGPTRIETRGTGYRLPVEEGELDLARFTQLVRDGAGALQGGDAGHAAERLSAALELWRGPALADLGREHIATAEAPQLDERRLQAQELLNDAELARGRHDVLVPQLEQLIAAEPFRERFRIQHALALYRSGRQKDALEAYRAARDVFVEELGVDPSPELQELERAILRQDPALAAPERAAPPLLKLPAPPTSLVGRGLEVASVTALLRTEGVRLLTLTGPGGTGKTRLALAVAAELGPHLPDGAVFVDLAAVQDASLLAPTIAHALEIPEGGSVEDALQAHLSTRRMLVILDNVEQLVPRTELVAGLLAAAPRLLVLATSRTPLHLAGEQEYPVPPLATPPRAATFEELAANDAVRLFVARARSIDPEFELDEENAWAVAQICEGLDGLPLAIELAAARSKLFAPDAMKSRLERRLELLTGGPHDVPARQQTLRSTLEWSYELLDGAQRDVFARLSVFAGGWTIEAAEAVCGDGTLDTLARLVDNSLVRRLERSREPRFAMLETIGEYARERLEAAGESEVYAQRHADYMLAFAVDLASKSLFGDPDTIAQLDDDLDNIRAALHRFASAGDVASEVRMIDAIWNFLTVHGHLSEGRTVLESVIARSADAPPKTRALAHIHCGAFAFRQGDLTRAQELTERALVLFRELGDANEVGRCIGTLGNIAVGEGELDRAIELYEEAAELAREDGNRSRLAAILANLGSVAGQRDDAEASARYAKEAVAIQRELGEVDGVSISLHNLGRAELALGDLDAADTALTESLVLARELGYREVIAYVLSGLAELALLQQREERAAELLGASEDLFRELGVGIEQSEAKAQERILTSLYETLGPSRTDELRARGAGRPVDELLAA
jgi:predicted ATPase/DNA-binding SARP family transcriptional activator